ncbi:drug/metabolite transporter (DMT)-like permease [Catalinimonas alkaloidigena]|uniref:DMT family transporter n=1 Tax=Catalinimonas alkaloidigena TaxID=1075417 RepID=UPI002404E5AA|nr:DMT family transporter [Catalinimonas alkaloidigena]MDF9797206.1 drug/metabolite transporter (DMT)-like permease [Catalinimonas alkaloidigena]
MKINPYIEVILAVCIMGSSGLFIKILNLPPVSLSFFRMAIPATLLFIYFSFQGKNLFRGSFRLMLVGSVMNAARIFLFITSYTYTNISNAVIILYTWPVFATIFSMIFLKEKVAIRNQILLLLPITGIVLMFINQTFSTKNDDFIGMCAMLLSAIIYAMTIIIFKKESHKYSGYETVFFQNLAGGFIFLPFFLQTDFSFNLNQLILIPLFGIIIGIGAFGLFFSALKKIKASTVSFLTYLEVIIATMYGVLIFDEKLSWNIIAGGCLIIISTILIKKN